MAGSTATIQRPVLPPLPPALRSETREDTTPFVQATHAPAAPPVAAPISQAPPAPVAAPAPAPAPVANWDSHVPRPDLPPTPPEISPHGGPNPGNVPDAPATGANPLDVPVAPPVAPISTSETDTLTTETADTSAKTNETPTPDTSRKTDKTSKLRSKIQDKSAQVKAAGASRTDRRPILAVIVGLVLLAGGAFFVTGLLTQETVIADLSAGQCVEEFFPVTEEGFLEISSVSTIDCATAHAYEVFAVDSTLFEGAYPGVQESFTVGQEFCLSEYESFIGGSRENLETWDVWTFVPPESSWEDGSDVHCLVGDAEETALVTGSLRDEMVGN